MTRWWLQRLWEINDAVHNGCNAFNSTTLHHQQRHNPQQQEQQRHQHDKHDAIVAVQTSESLTCREDQPRFPSFCSLTKHSMHLYIKHGRLVAPSQSLTLDLKPIPKQVLKQTA